MIQFVWSVNKINKKGAHRIEYGNRGRVVHAPAKYVDRNYTSL